MTRRVNSANEAAGVQAPILALGLVDSGRSTMTGKHVAVATILAFLVVAVALTAIELLYRGRD
jgi:hypothetical protein